MSVKGAQTRISQAVTSWPDVTVHTHRFGGVEYVIGKREVGHIHGDHLVDIPFPKKVREEIVAAGRTAASCSAREWLGEFLFAARV